MSDAGAKTGNDPVGKDYSSCRVVVADDDPAARHLLRFHLATLGVGDPILARDGIEALQAVRESRPDLVILDLRMPRMDGFEVLRELRADPAFADVPILVQTAADSQDTLDEVFRAGATDFVTKGFREGEVLARMRVHLENRLLVRSLKSYVERLDRYRQRIDFELDEARRMQMALLPPPVLIAELERLYGLAIQSHFETSSELGGDLWRIWPLDDDRLALFVCDFAGHGISAAINTFRLNMVIRDLPAVDPGDPAGYLGRINRQLAEILEEKDYATALVGILDLKADTFTYAAAGSPNPLIGGPGEPVRMLDGRGLPIGITAAARYENRRAPFPPGAFLFLYSDALFESGRNSPEGIASREDVQRRIGELLESGNGRSPMMPLLDDFYAAVPRPPPDDLTLVWCSRRPAG